MRIEGDFREQGYALVERLVHPDLAHAFMAMMERDLAAQKLSYNDFAVQTPLAAAATVEILGTSYPPMLTFLWGLTPFVSRVAEKELLPSFCYFRIYGQGDRCRVHSDRPACEYSISLTLAYADGQPWPLEVGLDPVAAAPALSDDFGGDRYRALAMMPGDGVLYRGVRTRHGRMTPNPNRSSAHLFLHWVEAEGPHREHAFDAQQKQAVAGAAAVAGA